MRFIANGPSIPDQLLVARDAGNVLFFCGAGVSRESANLPDFNTLAKVVMESLGVIESSPAKRVFEAADRLNNETKGANVGGLVAADRLFALLEREFDVADVRSAVAAALRPDLTGRNLTPHRTLLELSKGSTGISRLVTTNFDLLFEACDATLSPSGPPHLPDPRREKDFQGVIHLHGRVTDSYDAAYGEELVLSSADFGHAYLAEGWATRYINLLLQRFQIVFVGYSADDPPVQYLLEALKRFGPSQRNAMYAFHGGDEGQAIAQWSHKGVMPLAFREFSHLWETLSAWAARARGVDKWHDDLITMAIAGPASMQPHERGMVAHMASTEEGSHRLAYADCPIPAEWLSVFDKYARLRGPAQEHATPLIENTEFFKKVGLDSDAAPESSQDTTASRPAELPESAWDAFTPTDIDVATARPQSLPRIESSAVPPLPRRLANLGRWFLRVSHEPAALIWAAGETSLHADLRERLISGMRFDTARYSELIRKQWQWILDSWNSDRYDVDSQFHLVEREVQIDGWTPALLRAAMRLYRARLNVKPAHGVSIFDRQEHQLVHASVDYVSPYRSFIFPASVLPDALSLMRIEIESAMLLEAALHPDFQPSLEAGLVRTGQSKNEFAYGINLTLLVYIEMLLSLSETDRETARAELARWPRGTAIAERLSIAAAAASGFFSPEEAGNAFVGMSDENFWDSSAEQDVSIALGLRWSELPDVTRRDIEHRVARGTIPSYGPISTSGENQAYVRLSRLYALKKAGIDLTAQYAAEVNALLEIVPSWTEAAWQDRPRTGVFRVSLDTDSSVFDGVPLISIVDVAMEHHGKRARRDVEAAPFLGLARDQPCRALRALELASRRGKFSAELWHTILSEQVSVSGRLATMAARRLTKLPFEFLSAIRRPAARWLHEHAAALRQTDPQAFIGLWNALFGILLASQTEEINSARRWVNESLNSTAGHLVGALFATVSESPTTTAHDLDAGLKDGIARLLDLPPPHRQRAIFVVATQLDLMYARDPEWVQTHLLILAAAPESSDSFFQGTLTSNTLSWGVIQELRPHMLERLYEQQLPLGAVGVLAATMLNFWLEKQDPAQTAAVSDLRLRETLIRSSNEFRVFIVRHLAMWSKEAAGTMDDQVLRFIHKVWPLQIVVKTTEMTERLVELAFAVPARFTEAITLLQHRLVRASDHVPGSLFYQIDKRIVEDHCPALVDLLWRILPASSTLWGDGIETLIQRLDLPSSTPQYEKLVELLRRAKYRL